MALNSGIVKAIQKFDVFKPVFETARQGQGVLEEAINRNVPTQINPDLATVAAPVGADLRVIKQSQQNKESGADERHDRSFVLENRRKHRAGTDTQFNLSMANKLEGAIGSNFVTDRVREVNLQIQESRVSAGAQKGAAGIAVGDKGSERRGQRDGERSFEKSDNRGRTSGGGRSF